MTERVLSEFDSDSVLTVDYDEFCDQPESELRRMFRFLRIPEVAVDLDLRSKPHHLVGNSMRFLRDFSAIRKDERWQQILSPREMKFLEAFRNREVSSR